MTERPDDEQDLTNPRSALEQIKTKLLNITREYSAGQLSVIQFNAMYRHYMEKRTIIEKLLQRNPETDAWKAASAAGQTSYLRNRYEARPLYYVVFRHGDKKPLRMEGKLPRKAAQQVHKLLQVIWRMKEPKEGLARKSLGDGMWLLLMAGQHALTIVVYFFQPSTIQMNRMKDLHRDFERANQNLLERNFSAERMVFPQRSLMEKS